MTEDLSEQTDTPISSNDNDKKSLTEKSLKLLNKFNLFRNKEDTISLSTLQNKCSNGESISEETLTFNSDKEKESTFMKNDDSIISCDDNVQLVHVTTTEGKKLSRTKENSQATKHISSSRKLFRTASRFRQTKPGIILGKAIVLLVCVLVLVGGAIIAATVRQHPEGCGQENSLNCSEVCLNSPLEGVIQTNPPPILVTVPMPSPVMYKELTYSDDCLCELVPTPSMIL